MYYIFIYLSISLIYPFNNLYKLFIINVYIQYFIIINMFYIMVPIIVIIGYYNLLFIEINTYFTYEILIFKNTHNCIKH